MKRRWIVMLEVALLAGLLAWVVVTMAGGSRGDQVAVKIRLKDARENAELVRRDGLYRYEIKHVDGTTQTLTPEELAERTYRDRSGLTWWMRLLNITGLIEVIWFTVGLLGQVLFTGRMLVQWLVSEKHKRSVVPPAFWWMSLVGATMLVVYFIWRQDPVGILGQSVGWFVYVRNLWMIYRPQAEMVVETPRQAAALNGGKDLIA